MVALRNNPCMSKRDGRTQLLGTIKRLRQHGCTLRIVDKPITVDERVEAWRQNGGSFVRSVTAGCGCGVVPRFTVIAWR